MRLAARLLLGCVVLLSMTALWAGQPEGGGDDTWLGVVSVETTPVYCGRNAAFYTLGEMKQGEMAVVLQVQQIVPSSVWATVDVSGRYDGLVMLSEVKVNEAGEAVTVGTARIYYIKAGSEKAAAESWRGFDVGDGINLGTVKERLTTEDGGVFLRVALPAGSAAYVPASAIREATEAERAAWEAAQAAGGAVMPVEVEKPVEEVREPVVEEPVEEAPVVEEVVEDVVEEAAPDVAVKEPQGDDVAEEAPVEGVDESGADAEGESEMTAERALPLLADLESAYEALKGVPLSEAEIQPLVDEYARIRDAESASSVDRQVAEIRIEMLEIRLDAQASRQRIEAALSEARGEAREAERVARLGPVREITAQGVVAESMLYDGMGLPLLYRLREPNTGRTILYLEPTQGRNVGSWVGKEVSVTGTVNREAGLSVTVVQPESISATGG